MFNNVLLVSQPDLCLFTWFFMLLIHRVIFGWAKTPYFAIWYKANQAEWTQEEGIMDGIYHSTPG